MTIDGIDSLIEYGAEQWNVTPGFCSIKNESEWMAGAIQPLMLPGTVGLKKYKVSVMIRGSSRQEIWENGSRLVARLMKPSVIRLNDFDNNFMFVLSNASQAESSIRRWHKATLEFVGYEYGNEVSTTYINTKSITMTNEGNMESPCILEIVPTLGKTQLAITGLVRDLFTGEDKPIKISGLTKDKAIMIDSDTGLITESGVNKFEDVELYELPSLLPGENKITLNQSDINITIKYKPMYI